MRRYKLIERRSFLGRAVTMAATVFFPGVFAPLSFSATKRRYEIALESLLPYDIRQKEIRMYVGPDLQPIRPSDTYAMQTRQNGRKEFYRGRQISPVADFSVGGSIHDQSRF